MRIQTLEMQGISKKFHDFYANKDVDLKVLGGEILGLLGENGAGKSTLMNILYGLYHQDEGQVIINGTVVRFKNPKDSIAYGIGMVHQHFMLVSNHTVAENIAMGMGGIPFFNPIKKIRNSIKEFGEKYGLNVDPDEKIYHLSAGELQRVEIVKALMHGADLLILDEPTSVLTPQEAEDLFRILRVMKADGHAIIIITHKMEEILNICDRALVLRKGQKVGEMDRADFSPSELAKMMVGREVLFSFDKPELEPGDVVLSVKHLRVRDDRGLESVKDISFEVRKNQVFGIAGVSGNGQRELVESITGLRPALSGQVIIADKDITNESARVISNMGVGHVPEERIRFGIVPNLMIFENSVLKHHHNKPFSDFMFLDYKSIRTHAEMLMDLFQVSAPGIVHRTRNLSGGNIQKLILGREIVQQPDLLIASHPTYGLDVGATEYIRKQILERRNQGGAVLLVSEDLEELFEVCDQIAVIHSGEFMGILSQKDWSMEKIGLMMAGTTEGVSE
ncbi:ABC transporter ATP-binding protein [Spirochaeta cellobiosiphila]|uniref:ABC transporter ATP-binding protein n=1 Tax=Spirochaeta cellobiosiphila TaxID=504483 RepID=UPI000425E79E|nr:ABC transporter ATP-binding protein [Spirochaeta cellobiosiphila]